MPARLEAVPRQRIELLLQQALSRPVADLPFLPVNRAEWERVDALYRPLLQDLLRRVAEASDIDEIDALGRIARGLIAQRQAELDELRRYVSPPARLEPTKPESCSVGLAAACQALAALQEEGELGGSPEWQPLAFVGLARLQPWLSSLGQLFASQRGQVGLAMELGFRFEASHSSHHELARRLLLDLLVRNAACQVVLWSPIPARYRPAWDVWGADRGIVGSVQADLCLDNLAAFGPRVLWARQGIAADGVGYLVLTTVLPDRRLGGAGSTMRDEQVWRQRWQRAVVEAMLPRPGRKLLAEIRATLAGLRRALREALADGSA